MSFLLRCLRFVRPVTRGMLFLGYTFLSNPSSYSLENFRGICLFFRRMSPSRSKRYFKLGGYSNMYPAAILPHTPVEDLFKRVRHSSSVSTKHLRCLQPQHWIHLKHIRVYSADDHNGQKPYRRSYHPATTSDLPCSSLGMPCRSVWKRW